jgi:beta-glucosidase
MTFPRTEGQIPIYYNHFNTGRPSINEEKLYKSSYIDLPNTPKFPFGYGLSYTTFNYSNLKLSNTKMKSNEKITVTMDISNTGKYDGEEIVQLYIQDQFASLIRPILELKDFQKIKLAAGETKTISFIIDNQKLSFYNKQLEFTSEPGTFNLFIGASSADIRLKSNFELVK